LTLVQRAKRESLPLPAAVIAATPWTDLSLSGDSYEANAPVNTSGLTDELLQAMAKAYAGGKDLKDPLISPLYGDFSGFPPTFLAAGTRDLLLSDVVRVHHKLRLAGNDALLDVYEGLSHGQFLSLQTPEGREFYHLASQFLDRHLGL